MHFLEKNGFQLLAKRIECDFGTVDSFHYSENVPHNANTGAKCIIIIIISASDVIQRKCAQCSSMDIIPLEKRTTLASRHRLPKEDLCIAVPFRHATKYNATSDDVLRVTGPHHIGTSDVIQMK